MLKAGADLSPQVFHELEDLRVFLKEQIESLVCLGILPTHENRLAIAACCLETAEAIGFQDDVNLIDKIRAFEQE
ncbi:hypothetical protein J3E71DRAFT_338112 [Bipolaris maydis]|nr:hypothetical protein J3E71DRAFT_338112 [Bipolaris maydis]